MQIRKITAPLLFLGEGTFQKEKVIVFSRGGEILDITPLDLHDPGTVEVLDGILCPGLINAHCHLELSHLKGLAPTGTRLISFLKHVVTNRNFSAEIIQQSIQEADQYMWEQGTQAVGDICNTTDSLPVKINSPIHYHSFIELFDFWSPALTEKVWKDGVEVFKKFQEGGNASLVPHAPYSVSVQLLERIYNQQDSKKPVLISIHNQEMEQENAMFYSGDESILNFFREFGIPDIQFQAPKVSPINWTAQHIPDPLPLLLIHNTCSTLEDLKHLQSSHKNVSLVTCPNANLYIENRLPDYASWIQSGINICLGTDSLTSNWQLSILDEIKTIHKYNSWIHPAILLSWATIQGAKAMHLDQTMGSLERGKTPGILQLTGAQIQDEATKCRLDEILLQRVV